MNSSFSKIAASWNARRFSWCIKWQSSTSEFIVYPRGGSTSHPSAYYTPDSEDALRTAEDLILRERGPHEG